MTWSTPADLRERLARLWDRGELLRDVASGTPRFPLRLACRLPSSQDMTDHFEQVRNWVATLAQAKPLRVEWQEVRHRVQGTQCMPESVWIDTLDDALGWLGRRGEAAAFQRILGATRQTLPELLPWLEKRPLQALDLVAEWPRLLAVVGWLKAHPCPGIYLRQVDIPGVHSKFIEAHRAVLGELLDLALLPACIDAEKTGTAQFAARYGFREKPLRLRCRVLDPAIQTLPGVACPDLTLDAESFRCLSLPGVSRVLITENEVNFLALPQLSATLAVFGSGYGWDALRQARWLEHCVIHYWGDIDTHGFAILDQLRGCFGHVSSLLMDRATLHAHEPFWGFESKQTQADLHRLGLEEQALYDDLRFNRIREGLRLEQEHVGFGFLQEKLARLPG